MTTSQVKAIVAGAAAALATLDARMDLLTAVLPPMRFAGFSSAAEFFSEKPEGGEC